VGPAYGRLPLSSREEKFVNSAIWRFVARFAKDEQGQDLVEYALLGAFVAIATIAGLKAIENAIGSEYVKWDQEEQILWEPPDP
jgi:Flp pilus assembly pilin Flp